mgnify:CR=1 FL=1
MPTYYAALGNGDSYDGAMVHTDPDCLDGHAEPLTGDVLGDEVHHCPDCAPSAISTGPDARDLIDAGICPWCDSYEGDHVGQHASSAHPEKWDAYTDD